jgi:RHS repeat-associated protein
LETNSAAGDRYKYTGREAETDLGLYYYRARFYDPTLGRFISQDPLGFAGGDINLYRYLVNNPLTATDPFGLEGVIAYPTLVQAAKRAAGGAAGFAVGYVCGYLEAWYSGSDDPHRDARNEAVIGAAIGAVLGPILGYLPGKYQLWTGIAAAVYAATTSQDFVVFGIRSTCITVEFAVGGGFRNLKDVDLKGIGKSIGRFLGDEAGTVPVPKGTVWDRIKPTQDVWPGTEIPRSFELTTHGGQRVWVHGNATEHVAERVIGANGPGMRLELGRVVQQSELTSLEAAVDAATRGGVHFDEIIRIGGWELKFARPRNPRQLPALIHAFPLE